MINQVGEIRLMSRIWAVAGNNGQSGINERYEVIRRRARGVSRKIANVPRAEKSYDSWREYVTLG